MTATKEADRAPEIAWMIVKVLFNLLRFVIGGMLTILSFLPVVFFIMDSQYTGETSLLWQNLGATLLHVLLLAALAYVIWPQRYGPATKLIEMYQRRRANKAN